MNAKKIVDVTCIQSEESSNVSVIGVSTPWTGPEEVLK